MKRRLKDDLKASLYYIYVQIELPLRPLLGAFFEAEKIFQNKLKIGRALGEITFRGRKDVFAYWAVSDFSLANSEKSQKNFLVRILYASSKILCFKTYILSYKTCSKFS